MIDDVIAEARRLGWTRWIRPASLRDICLRVLRSYEHRAIVATAWGLRFYLDPMSDLGEGFIEHGGYEPWTRRTIAEELRPGGVFIDLGAHEGVFSCLASSIVGPAGRVVAVEPQLRLADIFHINCALNRLENCRLISKALSDQPAAILHLWPRSNSGASSLVNPYAWGAVRRSVETMSFPALLETCQLSRVDLIKIDVEGYEKEVIDSMQPAIAAGQVRVMLVDYHASILRRRGISANDIHARLLAAGMLHTGWHEQPFEGYGIYRRA
ncbi:MAG: FkbM family methyltransferase [Alphaproteobacteria bacterium]|nr:FkbM family methyltransferase [Alphaproteobacteria bacterium]